MKEYLRQLIVPFTVIIFAAIVFKIVSPKVIEVQIKKEVPISGMIGIDHGENAIHIE